MKTNINLLIANILPLLYFLLLSILPQKANAQTYPCASPSPLPYPESNACLQAFLAIRPDCCDIDFDMTCYTDPNAPGGLLEACDDGIIISGFPTTWENCYDHTLYEGINIQGTNPTCLTSQVVLPPLPFVANAYECCDVNNCSGCFPDCDPPPTNCVAPPDPNCCPLEPVLPYDGCLVEVILFDGICKGTKVCNPPGDPNCVNEISGGWDMCCEMIYTDLMNGVNDLDELDIPAYDNCFYGNSKPTGNARYPCDDFDPCTLDQCHPVIGCINIPNYANVTPVANIKLWLQGPSLGAVMATNPNISSSHPFNTAPWNYGGSEGAAIPSNAVDWILVEALDATFTVIDQTAGFLLNDGTVQDIDGTTGQIKFRNGTLNSSNNYYIAVRTRGHLDVMSAIPVGVACTTQYDFTTSPAQAYNTSNSIDQDQLVEANGTGTGAPYALYSGDTNGDGIINFEDFNDYFLQIGAGYKTADFNHDGTVNGSDFNPHFSDNNGKMNIQKLRY